MAHALEALSTETILKKIIAGGTLGNLRGLTKRDLESIYAIGHGLYASNKFDEAQKVFQFLCFYGHLEKKYWKGLAGCRQALGRYQEALEAYAMMAMTDTDDPEPAFYAAQCFFKLNRETDATKALMAVVDLSGSDSKYADIKRRAGQMLDIQRQDRRQPPAKK